MGGQDHRREQRFRVHLAVRFASARDFVTEYAENLSNGGLFVTGATNLQPLADVQVEVELPGLGQFLVDGRVAHVLDEALAARMGRSAGAGIEITRAPSNFRDALERYLHRLGRRRDKIVLVEGAAMRAAVESSGFRTIEAPEPSALVAAIARADGQVVGLVVPEAKINEYQAAAYAAGAADVVLSYRELADLGPILTRLDDET